MAQVQFKGWSQMENPPKLSQQEWNMSGLLGIVFLVMAVLQLVGFNDFKSWIEAVGMGSPGVWAVILIIAEVWAAIGLFKIRLNSGLRMFSWMLALLVSGFWFLENLRLVSEAKSGFLQSSGLFGKYLNQTPGWWTVIEVSVLLFWTIYVVGLIRRR